MNAFGSVAWGESSKGVLNEDEKLRVVQNLKFVMSQEQLDADRRRLGLLNPKYIRIETLTPPDSKMVRMRWHTRRKPTRHHYCATVGAPTTSEP